MKTYCSLRIRIKGNIQSVNKIMGIKSRAKFSNLWIFDIQASKKKSYWDVLNTFIDLIDSKFQELHLENIERKDITIWLICEYIEQCNLEFNPMILEKIGKIGITLCISCYQK